MGWGGGGLFHLKNRQIFQQKKVKQVGIVRKKKLTFQNYSIRRFDRSLRIRAVDLRAANKHYVPVAIYCANTDSFQIQLRSRSFRFQPNFYEFARKYTKISR